MTYEANEPKLLGTKSEYVLEKKQAHWKSKKVHIQSQGKTRNNLGRGARRNIHANQVWGLVEICGMFFSRNTYSKQWLVLPTNATAKLHAVDVFDLCCVKVEA